MFRVRLYATPWRIRNQSQKTLRTKLVSSKFMSHVTSLLSICVSMKTHRFVMFIPSLCISHNERPGGVGPMLSFNLSRFTSSRNLCFDLCSSGRYSWRRMGVVDGKTVSCGFCQGIGFPGHRYRAFYWGVNIVDPLQLVHKVEAER